MSPGRRDRSDICPSNPAAHSGLNLHSEPVSEEELVVAIAGMITSVVIILGIPLVIVHARKIWKRDSATQVTSSGSTDHRLERIEQAIDAMAVEVERVAESQRFMTKLLSDRANERVAIPSSQSRQGA